jgi:hypothetical protein
MSRNPISQLATLGEEVLGKAAQNPAAGRIIELAAQLKDRVDDLSKQVRGLQGLEERFAALEERVAELESAPKRARKPPAKADDL